MESGPTLSRDQQPIMIDKVTTEDIYNALLKIQDNKALGGDGLNALFFKKTWPIMSLEITRDVLQFFDTRVTCKAKNCALVTPIPKSKHP